MTNTLMLLSMPGGTEMIVILLIVVVLFGAKKIPQLARGIGSGIRQFNDAKNGADPVDGSAPVK